MSTAILRVVGSVPLKAAVPVTALKPPVCLPLGLVPTKVILVLVPVRATLVSPAPVVATARKATTTPAVRTRTMTQVSSLGMGNISVWVTVWATRGRNNGRVSPTAGRRWPGVAVPHISNGDGTPDIPAPTRDRR